MADYGHDLLFGSFITPTNAQPQVPVELAEVSEDAGLDLVTFQDHPYQPAFLDTWTLLAYVAARTERIRLSPNVVNLPLRPPAVLARAAASLDLLSGGRVELGLGAGAFWDAIEAMGARRLTAGQGVRALDEAIQIIRGIWAPEERGGVRVDGEFHHVTGAKRGPAPAHEIGIWLGAYKPKMLALTGRSADGWLPSLGYLQPGDLSAGNAAIDDAATSAGRSPHDVRRLLNITGSFGGASRGPLQGPVDQWVEELTEMVLAEGMSAFLLGTDDATDLRRFGEEVAPQVRAAVEAERVSPSASSPVPDVTEAGGRADAPTGARPTGTSIIGQTSTVLGVTPTPDDGTRLAATRPWDESTRPHRSPAPARTEYSETGRAAGQHLVDVHDHLRSELAAVQDVVGQVRAGLRSIGSARSEINTMTMRQNSWALGAYCAAYCTVVTQHHSLEDRSVFPHLRSADAELAPVIDRLTEEHLTIHEVLEGVDRALVALAADPDALDALQEAVNLLSDTLLSHLAYEEAELVEPLARVGFYPGQL
ncbi:LLM class flavin-dependent oxidoreductase [Sanguibacter sp. 25GB23B1]|uniref:LLM class flavin-dependent oxidoreductase n=1 Tax=unclassified Sanguibacter TaxID=2645534 RepID=UPI0032AEB39A